MLFLPISSPIDCDTSPEILQPINIPMPYIAATNIPVFKPQYMDIIRMPNMTKSNQFIFTPYF